MGLLPVYPLRSLRCFASFAASAFARIIEAMKTIAANGGHTMRRRFLRASLALATSPILPARSANPPLHIGLTPVFLDDQVRFLARLRAWLERRLDRPVVFVQRGNYREVLDLVRGGKIDFAWVCGYPYVRYQRELLLVAVPVWRGRPVYQSYLIVPAGDRKTTNLLELRDKVFAYSDPDSNSGFLYPQYRLVMAGENAATFSSRTFFTWAHRKVIEAVGVGLADGGAVDGYVWATLAEINPRITGTTRVVERSSDFGHTPFVARRDISTAEFDRFRALLIDMPADPEGAQLLHELRLDGFVAGTPAMFDGIARMAARVGRA